ncbi:MAG: sulfotransferase, partial [Cyanobacteria bacterium J06560_2]
VGPAMVQREFALSGYPLIKLSGLGKFYLKAQNWTARLSFRMKLYGPGLVLGDFVTRKLGVRQLNRRYRLKINAIQLKRLKKSW